MPYKTIPINNRIKNLTGSRKRTVTLWFYDGEESSVNTASYWSGGSKRNFLGINIITNQRFICPSGSYPSFDASHLLTENEIIISTGTSCGKPAEPYIYFLKKDWDKVMKYLELDLCQ